MASTLTFNGRLPGVVCETALPTRGEDPLRLDVAAFVGFAERGPVNAPIAVEDINQYRDVFGEELMIAQEDGHPVYANLPGAVQAFFDNGGRRCYVVRVVGAGARANRFRMPGLVAWSSRDTDPFEDQATLRLVIVKAASVGHWSNAMTVGTQLCSLPLHIGPDATKSWKNGQELTLELPPTTALEQGDILRLQFDGSGGPFVICSIASVTKSGLAIATTRGTPVKVRADSASVFTFARRPPGPLLEPVDIKRDSKVVRESLAFTFAVLEELPSVDEGCALDLTLSNSIQVGIGDLLHLTFADNRELFFPVTGVEPGLASPPHAAGEQSLRLTSQKPIWSLPPASVEKLGEKGWEPIHNPLSPVEVVRPLRPLEVQLGRDRAYRLYLPGGATMQVGDVLRVTCTDNTVLLFPVERVDVQQEGSSPEAVLRLVSREALWLLQQPSSFASPSQLTEVDLLSFDLFIREGGQLKESWSELRFNPLPNYWSRKLSEQARRLHTLDNAEEQHYWAQLLSDQSRRLQAPDDALKPNPAPPLYLPLGMYDVPGATEVTRALPDDGQLGSSQEWLTHKDGLDTFDPRALFLDSQLKDIGVRNLINEANRLLYLNPDSKLKYLEGLHSLLEIEEVGLIALPDAIHRPWGPPEPFQREEVKQPEPKPPDWSHFQDCLVPSLPPKDEKKLCMQPFNVPLAQDTEEPPDVRQQLALLPVLIPARDYQVDALMEVQKALVTLCAARADVVAILSLPGHFGRREALDWQQALQAKLLGETVTTDDLNMLSYIAVYHPWLQIPEAVTPQLAPLRAVPPDGACSGMIAARELVRGPWIAPANVPLRGVVALTPDLTRADWAALFDARINVVCQLPGQFTLMSAHTLSYDDTLVQISVRRLLIFLRKLALRRGMRYVFESNTERFRRRVQASLESTLTTLVARGGIVAFEVVTDESINTPNDFDNGRFLIALRVAPTLPIEFITVILLRTGEDLLNVIER